MKTVEDFKKAAKEKNITFWEIHKCGFCGYPCGYIIKDDAIFYDSGCGCVSMYVNIQPRSWEDLAEEYNRNTKERNPRISEKYTKETDNFWGF